ncbi:anthranilate synthase component I family protein [Candidatus Peregrinibacteria bacterium]|nr:anthranilate synthase component I family protein [Candidatus Peregrinibacteria bacterium]
MVLEKFSKKIDCTGAAGIFSEVRTSPGFLFESKDISYIYGRLSLIGIDPIMELRGKNDHFSARLLNERGRKFLNEFGHFDFCDSVKKNGNKIEGTIKKLKASNKETERTKRRNIAEAIRQFLSRFKMNERELIGLYGAFSYDFIRLFEDIPDVLPENGVDDFRLFLFDSFIFFDHLKDRAEITAYRRTLSEAEKACNFIAKKIGHDHRYNHFKISDDKFEFSEQKYKKLVENARKLAKQGELYEIVYSNTLSGEFHGDSFELYKKYSNINPSPYLFYFDFGDEQLIGASPEMMVRCENNTVHLRPISGTARRGNDPIEDHENMLDLLKSEKERAELDMLIDLGRNDLARICEPGIRVGDYRFVEKYSKVMHTVAHLSGQLRKNFTALDALIACMNAGTLTGAPKIAAMTQIEKNEKSRRGYYGGAIGYLTFSGDMDTGIIIRTAHIKDGHFTFRVGATLLYDSEPEKEYMETINKAEAFLTTIKE